MIIVENLWFSYIKDNILENLSFKIENADCVGLAGINGAGKTTLIWLLCNVLKASKGSIMFDGETANINSPRFKRKIGVLSANNPVFEDLTIYEHLYYVGRMYGLKSEEIKRKIFDFLEYFGVDSAYDSLIRELSTGNQRKVGIITTLLHSPDYILWDEPFIGLDPLAAVSLKKLIKQMKKQGKTIFLTSQQLNPLEELCNRIMLLDNKILKLNTNIEELNNIKIKHNVQSLEQLLVKIFSEEYNTSDDKLNSLFT